MAQALRKRDTLETCLFAGAGISTMAMALIRVIARPVPGHQLLYTPAYCWLRAPGGGG